VCTAYTTTLPHAADTVQATKAILHLLPRAARRSVGSVAPPARRCQPAAQRSLRIPLPRKP